MKIGGLQKNSLVDYPGKIAAIIFTQGCVFRCGYCHNPELVDPNLFTEPISEKEILSFLKKRLGQLEAVAITGGEPFFQKDLEDFLKKIKKMGYLIKLDTNGSFPENLKRVIEKKLVDYLAMDIKAPLEKYKEISNSCIDIEKIKKSIDLLQNSGLNHEFRTTVVKSQLKKEDLLEMAKLFKLGTLYILQKFIPSKTLDPEFLNKTSYSDEEMEEIVQKIKKKYNLNCIFR